MKALDLIDLKAALARLKDRNDISKLLNLESVRQNPSLARSVEYQKAYNHYYKMRQRRPAFYEAYYSILGDAALAPTPPLLRDILVQLYKATDERHLSFGSKLVATLDVNAAIYDRNVASLFGVSTGQLDRVDWLDEAMSRYGEVAAGLQSVVHDHGWPVFEAAFNAEFPNAEHLSNIRKADLILWSAYNDELGIDA